MPKTECGALFPHIGADYGNRLKTLSCIYTVLVGQSRVPITLQIVPLQARYASRFRSRCVGRVCYIADMLSGPVAPALRLTLGMGTRRSIRVTASCAHNQGRGTEKQATAAALLCCSPCNGHWG